jgi:hypothetical protein
MSLARIARPRSRDDGIARIVFGSEAAQGISRDANRFASARVRDHESDRRFEQENLRTRLIDALYVVMIRRCDPFEMSFIGPGCFKGGRVFPFADHGSGRLRLNAHAPKISDVPTHHLRTEFLWFRQQSGARPTPYGPSRNPIQRGYGWKAHEGAVGQGIELSERWRRNPNAASVLVFC